MFDVKEKVSGKSLTVCKAHGVYFFVREFPFGTDKLNLRVKAELNLAKPKWLQEAFNLRANVPMFDMYTRNTDGTLIVIQYDAGDRDTIDSLDLFAEFGKYEGTFILRPLTKVSEETIYFYAQCLVTVARNSGNGSVVPIMWADLTKNPEPYSQMNMASVLKYEGMNIEDIHYTMRKIETMLAAPVDLEVMSNKRVVTLEIRNNFLGYNRNHKTYDGTLHDVYMLLPFILFEAKFLDFIIAQENLIDCLYGQESWDNAFLCGGEIEKGNPTLAQSTTCSVVGEVDDPNPLLRAAKYGSVNNE